MTDAMAAVTALTGEQAVQAHPLTGSVCRVRLASGRTVVARRGTGMVGAEAASLRWLAAADVIGVPSVLGQDANWLILQRIESGRATTEAAEEFGRRLAALHASGAPASANRHRTALETRGSAWPPW